MEFLWMLIVGGVIGWFAQIVSGKNIPGGVIGNVIAGIIGSWLGVALLGTFGPVVGGFSIIPAIIGAVIFVFLFSLIARKM
ncbi:membrane protein [Paenibacillus swuensis]|uniref:Membrane protein n=1 Tax=Paenibacillus swuensis TaxID=1178515 RepID=A0A172TL07_9BACL|nr:GlsB/YeaQ/YmgE family stress response membrane protein [Paenibacillus swuensis]ANE47710.1 membrane protein [Paenibacillus swuensis]